MTDILSLILFKKMTIVIKKRIGTQIDYVDSKIL